MDLLCCTEAYNAYLYNRNNGVQIIIIPQSLTWIYKNNVYLVKISCIVLGSVSITWFINFVFLDNKTIYTGSKKNMLMCIMPVLR